VAERTDAGDARSYRVALIADELVNPAEGGIDGLAELERAGWGAVQLPASTYPDAVARPMLEQVAEQAEEFARHGYTLAVVGRRRGLSRALAAYGIGDLPAIAPRSADELRAYLASFA
jgi:hypothetical protein